MLHLLSIKEQSIDESAYCLTLKLFCSCRHSLGKIVSVISYRDSHLSQTHHSCYKTCPPTERTIIRIRKVPLYRENYSMWLEKENPVTTSTSKPQIILHRHIVRQQKREAIILIIPIITLFWYC